MTMRFIPTTAIAGTNSALRSIFAWFDFMRQTSPTGPGWTVPRSSDGTTVVTDGSGSNITAFGDLSQWIAATSISWFVLRSPDGANEYLWSRFSAADTGWQVRRSPGALFIGGDITVVPTAVDTEFFHQNVVQQNATGTLHMGADDEAPYGFFVWVHASGNFATIRAAWAHIPVSSTPAGDVDPYVHFFADQNFGGEYNVVSLHDENNAADRSRCAAIIPGGDAQPCPANTYSNSGGVMIPDKIPVDTAGNDLSFPILFGRSNDEATPGYKGVSTFMQWNGFLRAGGETFAGRTRISVGAVNFPWDGSVPAAS